MPCRQFPDVFTNVCGWAMGFDVRQGFTDQQTTAIQHTTLSARITEGFAWEAKNVQVASRHGCHVAAANIDVGMRRAITMIDDLLGGLAFVRGEQMLEVDPQLFQCNNQSFNAAKNNGHEQYQLAAILAQAQQRRIITGSRAARHA